MEKITIIGLGNMGSALLRGLLKSPGLTEQGLAIFDVDPKRVAELAIHPRVTGLKQLGDVPREKNVVILCIKPQDIHSVAAVLSGKLSDSCLLISILAGKTTESVAEELKFKGAVVRAMPNIAAVIAQAATAMVANAACTEEQKTIAEMIFKGVGEAFWTKESLMDTVTGLSGSGPAYIYMVIEALADGGLKMGMPRDLALKLATQTVLGAAAMVKETGLHPAILKDQVTTPAGTTISALHELEERGLRSMFVSAVEKATKRSMELGKA
ncbi:MAG: pyrroline-5-carboxylate reductase [Proteobacteria bacterium]|nr:MAG: pyrroline-5-carboxylate reductase [Pseudomonadota bacterium]